ncbi:PRD domain-containing protein [Vagococcus sp. PNs007]|uniref:PRD domain-containing protein n=1 Tax=Vagococcus proximus TaxID=2991417 RepID=A0ABT5X380_9ENTE|nr:PRD domain-containing protein [Vagococcus proximus]MDF0480445.1 PRD domain-containing protein [Vagococcus proximus]
MFDKLSLEILELFSRYENVTVSEAAKLLNINRRKLLYEIEKINPALEKMFGMSIENDGEKFLLPLSFNEKWNSQYSNLNSYIHKTERLATLTMFIYINNSYISTYHLQELLVLSKNSILKEMKELRVKCEEYGIEIKYSREEGYFFKGKESRIRLFAEKQLTYLLIGCDAEWILERIISLQITKKKKAIFFEEIKNIFKTREVHLVSKRLQFFSWLMYFIYLRSKSDEDDFNISFDDKLCMDVVNTEMREVSNMIFYNYSTRDSLFIATRIIAASDYIELKNEQSEYEFAYLTKWVLEEVSESIGFDFSSNTNIFSTLYSHLIPAYVRIYYDIPLNIPLTATIQYEYKFVFDQVKKGLRVLENKLSVPINDDEVGLFTIHFLGYLKSNRMEDNHFQGLVICEEGISSLLMLVNTLSNIFLNIDFDYYPNQSISEDYDSRKYDMIFSTRKLKSKLIIFEVKPVMSAVERNVLWKKVKKTLETTTY